MAGTTTKDGDFFGLPGGQRNLVIQYNKLVDDVEVLRAALSPHFQYEHEDLSADADISARPIWVAPAAVTVTSVVYLPRANSTGVDGSNTVVVTLRNITASANVASITRTTNFAAGTPVTVTLSTAAVAASDVLGITVTQGTNADVAQGILLVHYQRQTVDAAGDMTAAKIGDSAGTALSV